MTFAPVCVIKRRNSKANFSPQPCVEYVCPRLRFVALIFSSFYETQFSGRAGARGNFGPCAGVFGVESDAARTRANIGHFLFVSGSAGAFCSPIAFASSVSQRSVSNATQVAAFSSARQTKRRPHARVTSPFWSRARTSITPTAAKRFDLWADDAAHQSGN